MFFVLKFELILIIGSNNVLTEGARKVYRGRRVGLGCYRILTSPPRPERLWDPPSRLSHGIGGSFPGTKRPGSEADHSPPTVANVKKIRIYTTTPYTYSWREA
jgi:hypothetical protein